MQPNDLRQNRMIIKGISSINALSRQLRVIEKDIENRERDLARLREDRREKETGLGSMLLEEAVRIFEIQNQQNEQVAGIPLLLNQDENLMAAYRQNITEIIAKLRFLYNYQMFDNVTPEYHDLIERYS